MPNRIHLDVKIPGDFQRRFILVGRFGGVLEIRAAEKTVLSVEQKGFFSVSELDNCMEWLHETVENIRVAVTE